MDLARTVSKKGCEKKGEQKLREGGPGSDKLISSKPFGRGKVKGDGTAEPRHPRAGKELQNPPQELHPKMNEASKTRGGWWEPM